MREKIDANNTTTLRYLKEVNAGLRENNPKKQKNEDLISYQSGNETIIQPRYLKDNSAIGTIINMVIGIAIGAAITCFLIVPGVRREIQNRAKAEVLDANNAVASKNQSISSLEAQIEDLTSQITDAKNEEESSAGRSTLTSSFCRRTWRTPTVTSRRLGRHSATSIPIIFRMTP